jgi:histidyl-tRNA synthetase
MGEPALRRAAVLARDLRRAGFSVELAEGKLKRSMELANKLGARFTMIVGEDELAAGKFALKDMSTGEQQPVAPDDIAARLLETPLASSRN